MLVSFLWHRIDLLTNQVFFFPEFFAHQKRPNLLEVTTLGSSILSDNTCTISGGFNGLLEAYNVNPFTLK